MPSLLDRAIAYLSPGAALRRHQLRQILSRYEAAKPSRLRKGRRESGGPNTSAKLDGVSLREQARYTAENHDIARGALNILVANIVGANGVGIEAHPRTPDGDLHEDLALAIDRAFRDWARRPEVTWRHDWPSAQRIMARAWIRDGEALAQQLTGRVPLLDHGTDVPYSIELIEADLLPHDFDRPQDGILAGIERNAWGRPRAYHLLKQHPAEALSLRDATNLKRVPAERMLHLALIERIGQLRGVSVFASVLTRLEDIKDYEESERVAAKVAASMAAYIKKGDPSLYDDDKYTDEREMTIRPGMIFDDLLPGEEIGVIDTSRPNPQLEPHRNGQLRAAAAGLGCTYSALSKDYNGTYSAQRQELVEGYGVYGILAAEFINQFVRPVYERFVQTAVLAGVIDLPRDLDPATLTDAIYLPPQMPWIDPQKEANAWATLEGAGYASGPEIIRRRGQNPRDVLDSEARWKRQMEQRGLNFEPLHAAMASNGAGTQEASNA